MSYKFLEIADKKLMRIEEAINNGDKKIIKEEAHCLKGAAANLSAERLRSLFVRLEVESEEGNVSELGVCLRAVREELVRVGEFINDLKV
ncbi:MAG: Hpt domain-containing protein [bacterium]